MPVKSYFPMTAVQQRPCTVTWRWAGLGLITEVLVKPPAPSSRSGVRGPLQVFGGVFRGGLLGCFALHTKRHVYGSDTLLPSRWRNFRFGSASAAFRCVSCSAEAGLSLPGRHHPPQSVWPPTVRWCCGVVGEKVLLCEWRELRRTENKL